MGTSEKSIILKCTFQLGSSTVSCFHIFLQSKIWLLILKDKVIYKLEPIFLHWLIFPQILCETCFSNRSLYSRPSLPNSFSLWTVTQVVFLVWDGLNSPFSPINTHSWWKIKVLLFPRALPESTPFYLCTFCPLWKKTPHKLLRNSPDFCRVSCRPT